MFSQLRIQGNIVAFTLYQDSRIECMLYTLSGRMVAKPLSGYRKAGIHFFDLDTKSYGTGMFYLTIRAGNDYLRKPIVLLH